MSTVTVTAQCVALSYRSVVSEAGARGLGPGVAGPCDAGTQACRHCLTVTAAPLAVRYGQFLIA